MKKRGFTLIELLAVIVILAIIAFIAIPLILNVINDAKKGAFKDTVYGLIESAELYFSKQQLSGNNINSKTFTFPDSSELGYKGEVPKSGSLVINERGQVALAISNDKYCIKKAFDETEVTVDENLEECIVEGADYVDNSGANVPDLLNNMIPVMYDGEKWIYARKTKAWYNYDNKEWANAVVLNSGVTKKVGDTIAEDEVSLWYVWIPRYKYKLFNVGNRGVNEQLIEVEFETGTETTGTVSCTTASNGVETCQNASNGNWYTHPAFTLGDQSLTGIWVGKFEVSTSDSTCATSGSRDSCNKELPVTIKPNIRSWTNSQIVNFYYSIQKMTDAYSITNGDSHMMKNIEWGAVAYLKQSVYGLGKTDILNNSHTWGLTGGGNYKNSTDQSTTGNIYGIYDMSGGAWEHVMGNMVDSSGAFYSDYSGFTSENILESKYYDVYSYSGDRDTHARGHLGDATRETLKKFGEDYGGGWYGDDAMMPYLGNSWFTRGDASSNGDRTGVFAFCSAYSNKYEGSTRAVLTRR